MSEIVAPVIVDDSGDISTFGSVQEAARWIEAEDLRSGAYAIFDATGRRLIGTTHGGAVVTLMSDPQGGPDEADLKRRLLRFVDRVGSERVLGVPASPDLSLPELVEAVHRFHARGANPVRRFRWLRFGRQE